MSNNTTTYKNTSIGLIPSDWEVKRLGTLGKIISGLTYSPDDVSKENGILVLRSSNIQDRQLVFDDNVFVNVDAESFNPVQKNDILICVRNGSKSLIGKNALITDKIEGIAFGAFMAIFRSEHNNYLFQIFGSDLYQKEIHKNLGATINSINGSDLKEFKIPVPPNPEQQKIAAILSTWDVAIDNCKAIVDNLKVRNDSLTQKLLSGKMRVSGFEESKWKKVSFSDIAKINSETLSSKTSSDFSFYYIDLSRVKEGNFNFPNDKIDYEKSSPRARRIFKKGDVLMATVRPNLMGFGYVDFDTNEMICSTGFAVLEPKQFEDGRYIYYSLFSHKIQNQINSLITGSNYPAINSSDVENLYFPYSSNLKERIAITNILDKATQELNQYQQKLQTLQLQKKGLMQQLLTGKVRVKLTN